MNDTELQALNPTFYKRAMDTSNNNYTYEEVLFFEELENDKDMEARIIEDDGNLHITEGQLRACFDIGQDVSRHIWKRTARTILRDMNIDDTLIN